MTKQAQSKHTVRKSGRGYRVNEVEGSNLYGYVSKIKGAWEVQVIEIKDSLPVVVALGSRCALKSDAMDQAAALLETARDARQAGYRNEGYPAPVA